MRAHRTSKPLLMAAAGGLCALLAIPTTSAAATSALPTISPTFFAPQQTGPQCVTLQTPAPCSKPDDVTLLEGHIFVPWQNGVGPTGTPTAGTDYSTVAEYDSSGMLVAAYQLKGRCDGLTADPTRHRIFATVNEDNNSSLYVIRPGQELAHYTYRPNPAQQAPSETSSNGGTDAVSIGSDGTVYVAHSNPDPGRPNTAATYVMTLRERTAELTPLFRVDSMATDTKTGMPVKLALTDPDSNRFIGRGKVFGGDLLQVAQADGQIVIVKKPGKPDQTLERLVLSNAENALQPTIDDIVEVTGPGTLYTVDQGAGTVQTINTAGFTPGTLVVAQPLDSGNSGALGVLNPKTGVITHFANTFNSPKGLLFVPA